MGLLEDFGFDGDLNERGMAYRPGCDVTCFRYRYCHSPKLKRVAPNKGGVLFLLEEPTTIQDNHSDVFLGSFKKYVVPIIRNTLSSYDRVSVAFVAPCHPIDKESSIRNLTKAKYDEQIVACSAYYKEVLEEAQPKIVIPMGDTAWNAAVGRSFGGRLSGLKFMQDVICNLIPDQSLGYWLAPCPSPAYIASLFKSGDSKKKDDAVFYQRRLTEFLTEVLNKSKHMPAFPKYKDLPDTIEVIEDLEDATEALESILRNRPEYVAFDYETDALKLERPDLGIIMVGISDGHRTYAMPFFDDEGWRNVFRKILTSPIGKVAHHAKYEARCSLDKLGVLPHPWAWDTMYGARVMNNRTKINLKYLTYVNFGIAGYDTMEAYMKPPAEEVEAHGDNAKNSFRAACENDEYVNQKALLYVGQDALYTALLYERQREFFKKNPTLKKGLNLFMSAINPLSDIEVNGMVIDMEECDRAIAESTEKLEAAERNILEDTFVKKYWKEDKPFEYAKDDLGRLLDAGGVTLDTTDKGGFALDSENLEDIGLPLCEKVLDARKYSKIRDTYLINIKRESVQDPKDGEYKLHSSFNLHVADTYRTSSSGGVNMQNIPVHDPEANRLIRTCMVPPKGMCILGFDYKAMEVATGCCVHHDKNMLHFLETGGDMHKASAKGCLMYTDQEWEDEDKSLCKEVRGAAKRFNFASFYGSYYMQTGKALWKFIQKKPPLIAHLAKKGITTLDEYLEHMKDMDKNLWEEQFPQYGEWRKVIYKYYQEHGYVNLITGFRCYGPMSRNNSTNSPIQGPASHVLLWVISRVDEELNRRKMRSFVINDIHDALYVVAPPEEVDEVKSVVYHYAIAEVPNKFTWFSAPLAMELEYTDYRENGGSWANLSEGGYISA